MEREVPGVEPEVVAVINPKIIAGSGPVDYEWEGCLSIPGWGCAARALVSRRRIYGLIPRFRTVRVRYDTRSGRQVEETLDGFTARIFQHETDHLNGLLLTDRITHPK